MKKIERAIKHLETAIEAHNSIHPYAFSNGIAEGLKQALNACREIATGEHHDYEATPPQRIVMPWDHGGYVGERVTRPNWSWQRRPMGEKTVVD